jgi:hypothetical protein
MYLWGDDLKGFYFRQRGYRSAAIRQYAPSRQGHFLSNTNEFYILCMLRWRQMGIIMQNNEIM